MTTPPEETSALDDVPSPFREALVERGFSDLTLVQKAVMADALADADLRVSSQTGSGKTVALGLVLAKLFLRENLEPGKIPFGLVITPTRELAAQVATELTWLYAKVGARVVVVTGGTSGGIERRELSRGATLVVGTPGRLLDHLKRGSLDASAVRAVVLDEADRMLDMGFTEDLRAILDSVPAGRRTHMVSATFPREVLRLADAYQSNAVDVEGTRRGDANEDITHVVHIVPGLDREAAVINTLLTAPEEPTLAFTKTRDGAAELAHSLVRAGFSAAALTGDMEQSERTRSLEGFRNGRTRVLVATDVAARGIDLPDVTRVIHADPPGDPESYTHRSGRTGRAGRKGTSIMLVPPAGKEKARTLLRRAGIYAELLPVPSPEDVRRAQAESLSAMLGKPEEGKLPHADVAFKVAKDLLSVEDVDTTRIVATLVSRLLSATGAEPRALSAHTRVNRDLGPSRIERERGDVRDPRPYNNDRYESRDRQGPPGGPPARQSRFDRDAARPAIPRTERSDRDEAPRSTLVGDPPRFERRDDRPREDRPREERPREDRAPRPSHDIDWVGFRVTWGARHGADARRLMALSCRRGGVRGSDLGAIHVGPDASVVEVQAAVADDFERAAKQPDPRDPRVRFFRTEHGRDTRPGEAPSSPYLPLIDDEPRPRPAWTPAGGAPPKAKAYGKPKKKPFRRDP
jgi:ATP-dependent RNA helicase DeaD